MAYYKKAEDIYNEMFLGYTTTSTNKGSLIYNSNFPVALKISDVLLNLDEAVKKVFARTAVEGGYSFYMDLKAEEVGLTRKQATYAEIPVTIVGTPNTLLKNNSVVGTKDNRLYLTEQDLLLDSNGFGKVKVKADKPGALYNVKAGEINNLPIRYSGIISVKNENDYNGAVDRETDEDIYKRFLIKVRTPATSGNIYHYFTWALEVDGVGSAKVHPLWAGNGTVKVIIANSNKRAATPELVQAVKTHIDPWPEGSGSGQAPIGATVTVVSSTEKAINLTAKIKLATGFTLGQIQDAYTKQLTKYLEDIAFDTTYISINRVSNLLFDVIGAVDYSDFEINGGTKNIELVDEEIAVLGTIYFEVMP